MRFIIIQITIYTERYQRYPHSHINNVIVILILSNTSADDHLIQQDEWPHYSHESVNSNSNPRYPSPHAMKRLRAIHC